MELGDRKCKFCGKIIKYNEDYTFFLDDLNRPIHRECKKNILGE